MTGAEELFEERKKKQQNAAHKNTPKMSHIL